MKKLITIIMIIGMISLVVGAGLSVSNYLTKDKVSPILSSNLATDYTIDPIVCNNEGCNPICIDIDRDTGEVDEENNTIYEGVVHKCYNPQPSYQNCITQDEETGECTEYETLYYTNQELSDKRDTWETNVIATAENYLSNVEEEKTERAEGVEVTIKSK